MKALALVLLFVAQGAIASDVTSSVHKMYSTPNAQPNPLCDVYEELTLWPRETVDVAIVESKVEGICDLHVEPNTRSYILSLKPDSCGSRVGEDTMAGVRIINNKTRTCDDVIPALVVMQMIDGNGNISETLYSKDR